MAADKAVSIFNEGVVRRMNTAIGKSIRRKDAWDKVTGKAKYTDDLSHAGFLCARLLTSAHAHARILKMDTCEAESLNGVKAILTGKHCNVLFGPLLQDRPALAQDIVRYAGEPIAIAVAKDEVTAEQALAMIKIEYQPLPIVLTPSASLAAGAPLIHAQANGYKRVLTDIYPEAGTNIVSVAVIKCTKVVVKKCTKRAFSKK